MDKLVHPSGRETELVNTNRLIKYYDYCLNGKTGFTDEAGYCLASSAENNGLVLISVVLNADDENCLDLRNHSDAKSVTYGIKNEYANFRAKSISFDKNGFPKFDVYLNGNFYSTIKLSVAGEHNISNALACIAICHSYGISKMYIKDALSDFTGANRRMEYKGTFNNASVFDDCYTFVDGRDCNIGTVYIDQLV